LVQAWRNCFTPEAGWRRENLEGSPGHLWRAADNTDKADKAENTENTGNAENGARAYLAESCASTMDLAWTLVDGGRFPEMSWVAALAQTQGRGRFGRRWDSAVGNLFATMRLPDRAADAGPLLPLALGLIMADVLKKHIPEVKIKWPNDIFVGGKKAGGILIEQRQGIVMAGIGLNVSATPEPERQPWGFNIPACGLKEFGCAVEAPEWWRLMADGFTHDMSRILAAPDYLPDHLPGHLPNHLPDHMKDRVNRALAFRGESVVLENGDGKSERVRVLGIDATGGLEVETSRGKQTLYSGRILPVIMI